MVKFTVTEDLRIVCFNFEVVKFGEEDAGMLADGLLAQLEAYDKTAGDCHLVLKKTTFRTHSSHAEVTEEV